MEQVCETNASGKIFQFGMNLPPLKQMPNKHVSNGKHLKYSLDLFTQTGNCGRKKAGCDLSFPGNKLVSGDHCKIIVDEKSGQVSLEDTSTNGTVINKLKVVKKQTCPLQTGDVIYLVYRKNEPEHNVAYLYESLNEKQDITQDSFEANKENVFRVTKDTSGAGQGDDPQVLPSSPTTQACFEEPQPSTSTSDLFPTASTSSMEPTSAGQAPSSSSASRDAYISPKECGPSVASDEIPIFPSALPDRERASFSLSEPQDQEDLEPIRKKMKGGGDPDLTLQFLVADQCRDTHTTLGNVRSEAVKPDKMEETLTCIICQDLLHDCVSLQPCMHTFCAACYSGWMERSTWCPTCRCPVERICKNHILNNLVEAYLLQHPDKSRSEEDVRSMAARNKITQDMLQPKVRRSFSDEEGSSEDLLELSDVDSESSDVSQPYIVCRQCPEYRRQGGQALPCPGPNSEPGVPQAAGDAPSTSTSVKTAQDYVCALQGSHAICTCCFQPMPDRRAEREQDPRIAPQQCAVCLQPFCHLYWGCARAGCLGCLAPFCELDLGDRCLDGVLSNNHYESDVLKNYLATRGLTWKNMLTESLVALQRGAFLLSDYRITGNTVLCYCCGLRSFRELTYQYRQNIPASELPVAVTSRPDCYWGRNCRTQVKAHHAMKFNHICEQTRFKN
ncbi:E3 ubiquitin-protein ligase CHFR isoform X2 [Canis lupus baileyi]|uniref:E3 ubiquitin-protein ligase CHFR isoform X2 n=1 Tax=Canis lupus dingo TaxID=286419 RepID=UPI000BAA33EE|nr:E3 ubiquitin-protein ligase CHFR isoform X2 [Canis lupus dingo]XP_048958122.1 E3 ubiquitin-protein ligase CHFR isoform X2 [Canis lupus dingo]|eukprot:XP_022266122.1 E3 ubiquitin-protein ligase CHFR isoform X2 [Canis lupus familiaris]